MIPRFMRRVFGLFCPGARRGGCACRCAFVSNAARPGARRAIRFQNTYPVAGSVICVPLSETNSPSPCLFNKIQKARRAGIEERGDEALSRPGPRPRVRAAKRDPTGKADGNRGQSKADRGAGKRKGTGSRGKSGRLFGLGQPCRCCTGCLAFGMPAACCLLSFFC